MSGDRIRWDPIEVPGQVTVSDIESARYTSPEVEPSETAWAKTVAELHEVRAMIDALPPFVTSIDAPTTIIERIREELPPAAPAGARALPGLEHPWVSGYQGIELVPDNDLPRGSVRLHWSDGRIDVVRLDEAETEER